MQSSTTPDDNATPDNAPMRQFTILLKELTIILRYLTILLLYLTKLHQLIILLRHQTVLFISSPDNTATRPDKTGTAPNNSSTMLVIYATTSEMLLQHLIKTPDNRNPSTNLMMLHYLLYCYSNLYFLIINNSATSIVI